MVLILTVGHNLDNATIQIGPHLIHEVSGGAEGGANAHDADGGRPLCGCPEVEPVPGG